MGLIKAIGQWIGSVFVLTDWHAETSAGGRVVPVGSRVDGHDARVTRSIVSKLPVHEKGHNEPLTPDIIAKEPAATPAPPPKPYANHNPNPCPLGPAPAVKTLQHRPLLVLVQQLAQYEVPLLSGGAARKWCGMSAGGVVTRDTNAVLTLLSLVKAVVGEGGGSPQWLSVRVVRLDGRAADYDINIANPEWSRSFEKANTPFVTGC